MALVAIGLSVLALASRGVGEWAWAVPAGAGVTGILVAPSRTRADSAWIWLLVTLAGSGVFVVARSAASIPPSAGRFAIAAAAVAAIGEELVFRRAVYGLLERRGAALAIGVSSVLFALVHVPMYGWRLAALDLAAGAVFGWQRWATGTWTSPAAGHLVANVVQYL